MIARRGPVRSWTLCPWTVRRMSASSSVRMTPRRFGVHTPSSRLRAPGPRLNLRQADGAVRERRAEAHELVLAAFEAGKGIKDVDRWFGSGYQGEPPVTFLGGMQTIPAGESVFLTIDLEPGVE